MDASIKEFAQYRLAKADEVYEASRILFEAKQWNSCINRLYYACFYAASALLILRGIGAKSHGGVISKFSETAVLSGEVSSAEYKVYSKLLNWRTKGDYSDMFDFSEEDVVSVIGPTRQFVDKVKAIISVDADL